MGSRTAIFAAIPVVTVAAALATVPLGARAMTSGAGQASQAGSAATAEHHYVDTWAAAPAFLGPPYTDRTVRNIVHTSVGGRGLRVRLSNVFGTGPVTFDDVYVGLQS